MLIDNKTDFSKFDSYLGQTPKSVYDFILKHTGVTTGRTGTFEIVTGFFSIAGLSLLHKELSPNNKYRMILSELTGDDDFISRVIDLLQGEIGIDASLNLSQAAKNAIAFLKRSTVEVRAITNAFCHAKTYIYKDDSDTNDCYHLMGSSNLTEAGLGVHETANVELNVAHKGTDGDYPLLRKWFQAQWDTVAKAKIAEDPNVPDSPTIDVKEYFIKKIEECFGKIHTPEEIYYKILYEYFRSDLDEECSFEDKKEITLLKDSTIYQTLFEYQKKGVISLIKMLKKYNGAILADAVGLGKTFSALAVMKYFQNNGYAVMMLCPKKLEGNWTQYLRTAGSRFDRDDFDYFVRFHTDLQNDRLNKAYTQGTLNWFKKQKKVLVVIDESHNLRNDKSSRYETLMNELLAIHDGQVRDTKVFLLSATPINNGLKDIRNQFKLIAKNDDAAFREDLKVESLEQIFKTADRQFYQWCDDPKRTIAGFIKMLPAHFFDLTDKLIVARTRKMIEKTLGEDLHFPEQLKPVNEYDGVTSFGQYQSVKDVYEAMLKANLTAYSPTKYMTAHPDQKSKDWQDNTYREQFLIKMMAILFMKRLESSWYSCLVTIEKVLDVHKKTLGKVETFIEKKTSGELTVSAAETLEDEGEDEEEFTLRDNTINLADMERIASFQADLKHDVAALEAFRDNLVEYKQQIESGSATDKKVETLLAVLAAKQKKSNRKALVFTTFGDTAQYIYDKIHAAHPEWRIACVTGQNVLTPAASGKSLFRDVLCRFAPYSKLYKEMDWHDDYCKAGLHDSCYSTENHTWNVSYEQWEAVVKAHNPDTAKLLEDEIDILIATDCLSEGQNLQDADLVINYDIHWNPVRLIQRFGRIDRIGSPNKNVQAVNFWPTESYEEYLDLTKRINNRMALMRLAGTETQDTTKELAEIVKNDPIVDINTQKLIDQLNNGNIADIEDVGGNGEGSLGLSNFSLEVFRQDLVEYLEKNKDFFKRMPAGVFSGFDIGSSLLEQQIPEAMVAVIGYPRRYGVSKKPYEAFRLLLQPAGMPPTTWQEVSTGGVLDFLRRNKSLPRFVPDWIENAEPAGIAKLKKILCDWMNQHCQHEMEAGLDDALSGTAKIVKSAPKIEEKFDLKQWDLIAWEYVSRGKEK